MSHKNVWNLDQNNLHARHVSVFRSSLNVDCVYQLTPTAMRHD